MNNLSKKFVDEDGKEATMIASSNDNMNVNLNGGFTIVNHKEVKSNRLARKFKNSILGADIGVKSCGFSTVAILAVVIALAVLLVMYFLWRF